MLVLRGTDAASLSLSGPPVAAFGNDSDPALSRADPFCRWSWDGSSLTAETDRYGFFPLFYYTWEGGVMLSPSLVELIQAGAPTDLDDDAIAVALRCWMFVGNDTPFKQIRIFPPGGKLTWKPGTTATVDGRFVFGKRVSISRTSALDEYIERFRVAINRRPSQGTSIVPLSGGRDSRHIFLEMCASGSSPDIAVTVGGWKQQTLDAEIAAALSDRAGVRHTILSLPDSRWHAQSSAMPATHLCTFEHWWLQNLISFIGAFDGEAAVYEGAAGDVLSTAVLKSEKRRRQYAEGQFSELAESILDPEPYFRQFLPNAWYGRFGRELAVDRLVTELKRHAEAPNPLASFFVYNRTRRVTSIPPTTLFSPHATVWCPYLDADVWDFLSSLEPELLESDAIFSFHDDAIHRAYPKFADIPFSAKWGVKPRRRRYELRTVAEMITGTIGARHVPIRGTFLWPRLARGLIDSGYTTEAADLASIVAYLTALAEWGGL